MKGPDSAEQPLSKKAFKEIDISTPFLADDTFRKPSSQSIHKTSQAPASPLESSLNSFRKQRVLSFQIKDRTDLSSDQFRKNSTNNSKDSIPKNNFIRNVNLSSNTSPVPRLSTDFRNSVRCGDPTLVHTFAALNSAQSRDLGNFNSMNVNHSNIQPGVPTFGHSLASPRNFQLARVTGGELCVQSEISEKWLLSLNLEVRKTKSLLRENMLIKQKMLDCFGRFEVVDRKYISALRIMKGIEAKYEMAAGACEKYKGVLLKMLFGLGKMGIVEESEVRAVSETLFGGKDCWVILKRDFGWKEGLGS